MEIKQMRLIDADELKMNMFAYAPPEMIWDHGDIDHKINEMPTIDAVPVVRCKDCKYLKEAKINNKGFRICKESGMEITGDGFCSYAEKMVIG